MKLKAVRGHKGIYVDEETGRFYERREGKRRRLRGGTVADASLEAKMRPWVDGNGLKATFERWCGGGCPRTEGSAPRGNIYADRARRLGAFFLYLYGDRPVDSIVPLDIDRYPERRMLAIQRGDGKATVDVEMSVISQFFRWAMRLGLCHSNPVVGRALTKSAREVVHCTERAPLSGDDIHRLAAHLMENRKCPSFGWLFIWLCLTGCRISELYALRNDAPITGNILPVGHCDGERLQVMRHKTSKPDTVLLVPEAKELWRAYSRWHAAKYPMSPWWFPSYSGHINKVSLNQAIRNACRELGLNHISPHGCRSYFAGVMRNRIPDDRLVADFMGHSNPQMLQRVYGGRMQVRQGLSFLPSSGEPCWSKWLPSEVVNVIRLSS